MRKKLVSKFLTVLMATAITVTGLPLNSVQAMADETVVVASAETGNEGIRVVDVTKSSDTIELYSMDNEVSEYGHISPRLRDKDNNVIEPVMAISNDGAEESSLPAALDLRNYDGKNIVTGQIENQNYTGTCWAHGTIAAAESNLIKNGYVDQKTVNMSEAQIVWFMQGQGSLDEDDPLYRDYASFYGLMYGKECFMAGGNIFISTSALSRGTGTISENRMTDLSTFASEEDYKELSEYESLRYESDYILKNSNWFILNASAAAKQRNLIKQSLISTGAMDMAYGAYGNSEVENAEKEVTYNGEKTIAYYNYKCEDPYGEYGTNHEICLIGWDDNFPKSNFGQAPAGDGAWLCRNSWGEDYGAKGYFWISYYDLSLDDANTVEMIPRDTYGDTIYQYGGVIENGFGVPAEEGNMTSVNYFTAANDDTLVAVGQYFYDAEVPYKLTIRTGAKAGEPLSGTEAVVIEDTAQLAGFHTIDLSKEVNVKAGETFSVTVELKLSEAIMLMDNHRYSDTSTEFYLTQKDGTMKLYDEISCDSVVKVYTKPDTVKASVKPGTYDKKISVELSSGIAGAQVYYTTDGTEPTLKSTTVSDNAIVTFDIPEATTEKTYTIKAMAVTPGADKSSVRTFNYKMVNYKNAVRFTFDVENVGTLDGPAELTFDYTKDKVYEGFPKGNLPGYDFCYWTTLTGDIVSEGTVDTSLTGNVPLVGWYNTCTRLAVGQTINATDMYKDYLEKGKKYKFDFTDESDPKSNKYVSAKVKKGKVTFTAKKAGACFGYLYVKDGKNWVVVEGAPGIRFETIAMKADTIVMDEENTQPGALNLMSSDIIQYFDGLSPYENDIDVKIITSKKKPVIAWENEADRTITVKKKGTAVLKITLKRGGKTKVYKVKVKVKEQKNK